MERLRRGRKGLSPVVSSIIMCAVVLAIGASVWSVTYSASTIMRSDYYEEVMESVEKIKERFCIENVGFESTQLKIWISNYGEINTTIELIRVTGGGNVSSSTVGISIPVGGIVRVDVAPIEISLTSGMSITIEVKSTRGNKVYGSMLVP